MPTEDTDPTRCDVCLRPWWTEATAADDVSCCASGPEYRDTDCYRLSVDRLRAENAELRAQLAAAEKERDEARSYLAASPLAKEAADLRVALTAASEAKAKADGEATARFQETQYLKAQLAAAEARAAAAHDLLREAHDAIRAGFIYPGLTHAAACRLGDSLNDCRCYVGMLHRARERIDAFIAGNGPSGPKAPATSAQSPDELRAENARLTSRVAVLESALREYFDFRVGHASQCPRYGFRHDLSPPGSGGCSLRCIHTRLAFGLPCSARGLAIATPPAPDAALDKELK